VAGVNGAALVVGGASGIGRSCAAALAQADWSVVVADRQAAEDGEAVALDVRDRDALRAAAAQIAGRHGSIGAVVYAAGTARVTPILEIGADEWELVAAVNLTGAFNVLQACAPHMPAGASLTFLSSIDSAAPVPGLAHYCAAKAGLEALVRSAALELGERGLRVNAVLPGVVRTPLMEPVLARPEVESAFVGQTPLGRIADGADIADVVTFLASPGARWVTGVSLPVDGGMALREHPRLLQPD